MTWSDQPTSSPLEDLRRFMEKVKNAPSYPTPMTGSSLVPEGKMLMMQDPFTGEHVIYFHQRISRRLKWRRRHGAHRGRPRRLIEHKVIYRPDFDQMKKVTQC